MNQSNDKLESRRQFLAAGGRYLALGGLVSLITSQELKRRRLEGDPNCIKLSTCGDCVEFNGCNKAKAEGFRRYEAGV